MEASATLGIKISNAGKLFQAASKIMNDTGATKQEILEFLGSGDRPNLSNCILALMDGITQSDNGLDLLDAISEIKNPKLPTLRVVRTVTASTAHISPQELAEINEAFGYEPAGLVHRALDDINHRGLYLSPKDHGFIVRIPCDEFLEENLKALTPEMKNLVEVAVRQGAHRIEFDCDEDEIPGLAVHEH